MTKVAEAYSFIGPLREKNRNLIRPEPIHAGKSGGFRHLLSSGIIVSVSGNIDAIKSYPIGRLTKT